MCIRDSRIGDVKDEETDQERYCIGRIQEDIQEDDRDEEQEFNPGYHHEPVDEAGKFLVERIEDDFVGNQGDGEEKEDLERDGYGQEFPRNQEEQEDGGHGDGS
jgi:hypothetical protein